MKEVVKLLGLLKQKQNQEAPKLQIPSESSVTGGGDAVLCGCCSVGISQTSHYTPTSWSTERCRFLMQNPPSRSETLHKHFQK